MERSDGNKGHMLCLYKPAMWWFFFFFLIPPLVCANHKSKYQYNIPSANAT